MSAMHAFSCPGALLAGAFLTLLGAAALLAPWLCAASPWDMLARPLLPPFSDASHWLGTDMLGRDVATGLLYGARTSLSVGLLASLATLLPALLVGAVAGYFGGWIDELLMRIAECFQIIPQLVLAVVLVALLEPSVGSVVLALALVACRRWRAWYAARSSACASANSSRRRWCSASRRRASCSRRYCPMRCRRCW